MFYVFELVLVVGDCLKGRYVVSCGCTGCACRWFGFGRLACSWVVLFG